MLRGCFCGLCGRDLGRSTSLTDGVTMVSLREALMSEATGEGPFGVKNSRIELCLSSPTSAEESAGDWVSLMAVGAVSSAIARLQS